MFPLCENDGNVEDAQDIEAAEALLALLNSQNTAEVVLPASSYRDSAVQVNTPKVLTLCELISSDEKLKNSTGINNFAIFNSIVEIFEKYHSDKRMHILNIRQRIMLLLTKFKTSLTYGTFI
ncbi:hypothetical protein JTB14_028947 [Gonioctena quinquepunctata]|nr:hypothetical protein JTB14_028947 [Gonioctena quinquepunctata]